MALQGMVYVLPVLVAAWFFWYVARLAFTRLYFSSLRDIPGPLLAAFTQWYEFYYDVVLGGQYTFKIIELHKKYGPIVRISPWEIHISDPHFFEKLYVGRRQKWSFYTEQFGAPESGVATVDHDLHKLRRAAVNPFFSMTSVRKLQPVIEERVDAFLNRLLSDARSRSSVIPVDMTYPFSALTYDIIMEYSFARCDHSIEDTSWGKEVTDSLQVGTRMGVIIKHMNWALKLIQYLPEQISRRWIPGWNGFLTMKKDILNQIATIKRTEKTARWEFDVGHPTIFHSLLSSTTLPDREKSVARLAQEGQILVQAGTMTTSWALCVAIFHLLDRTESMKLLRDELFEAIPDPNAVMSLTELEKLPYLRAVIKETLRLSFGTSTRLARISNNEWMTYYDRATCKTWRIPPGTPVSMTSYITMTDGSIFEDAMNFRPERWLNEGSKVLEQYVNIFGGGSRICLGKQLAHAELTLILAKLFRRWGGGGHLGKAGHDDRRGGDVGFMKLFETTIRDVEVASDQFVPVPYKGSKGVRVVFEAAEYVTQDNE